MTEQLILSIPVEPARREELMELMAGTLDETKAYDGCLGVRVWLPDNDAGLLWVYEEWESREHQNKYFMWRVETGMLDVLAPFLTGPPEIIWLEERKPPQA